MFFLILPAVRQITTSSFRVELTTLRARTRDRMEATINAILTSPKLFQQMKGHVTLPKSPLSNESTWDQLGILQSWSKPRVSNWFGFLGQMWTMGSSDPPLARTVIPSCTEPRIGCCLHSHFSRSSAVDRICNVQRR